MSHVDPAATQSLVLTKLEHAFKTYDAASKKFFTALKSLDSAMEGIAIAFRELSHGEEVDMSLKTRASEFCTAIDVHKSAAGAEGGKSKSKKGGGGGAAAGGAGGGGPSGDDYFFSAFLSDVSREVGAAMTALKDDMKKLTKEQKARDAATKKYVKLRAEVDKLETKLAQKNESIAENPKFAEKVAKRDAAKAAADDADQHYTGAYAAFIQQRNTTVLEAVNSTALRSKQYFECLARVMAAGL